VISVGQESEQSWQPLIMTLSMNCPEPDTLVSVAVRHRNLMLCPFAEAGKFTVVVMNPPELPLQACRPPIGFWKSGLIVPVYPPVTKTSRLNYVLKWPATYRNLKHRTIKTILKIKLILESQLGGR
jgi:hypothetical protein